MKSALLVILAVTVAVLILGGADKDEVADKIKAKMIVICDQNGKECVTLSSRGIHIIGYNDRGDGIGSITLATCEMFGNQIVLRPGKKQGQGMLMLRVSPRDGSPAVSMWGKDGLRTILGSPRSDTFPKSPVHNRGTASLVFFDEHGDPHLTLP